MPITRKLTDKIAANATAGVVGTGDAYEVVLDQDQFVEDGDQGWTAEYSIRITGLVATTYLGKANEALAHPIVPRRGQFVENFPVPVSGRRFTEDAGSPGTGVVTISFGVRGGGFDNDPTDPTALPTVSIESNLQQVTANTSIVDGVGTRQPIVIPGFVPTGATKPLPPQVAEVQFQMPMHTVVATRRELGSPGLKSRQYSGTTNSVSVFGDPVGFWLLAINGTSADGGVTYDVTYSFQFNPDTWYPTLAYTGDDGRPHPEVALPTRLEPGQTGTGTIVVREYLEKDWIGDTKPPGIGLPRAFFT